MKVVLLPALFQYWIPVRPRAGLPLVQGAGGIAQIQTRPPPCRGAHANRHEFWLLLAERLRIRRMTRQLGDKEGWGHLCIDQYAQLVTTK